MIMVTKLYRAQLMRYYDEVLAHSSDPEDLMYPIIETNFPYASECDIDAIVLLYDGGETSQVICEN